MKGQRNDRCAKWSLTCYALYDTTMSQYITYDPVTEAYSATGNIAELKIWDVWDRAMIPYIKKDPTVPFYCKIRKLNIKEVEKLPFLSFSKSICSK